MASMAGQAESQAGWEEYGVGLPTCLHFDPRVGRPLESCADVDHWIQGCDLFPFGFFTASSATKMRDSKSSRKNY